jgi:hypothetical protein
MGRKEGQGYRVTGQDNARSVMADHGMQEGMEWRLGSERSADVYLYLTLGDGMYAIQIVVGFL